MSFNHQNPLLSSLEVLAPSPLTVSPDTPLLDAIALMANQAAPYLLVMQEGQVVGFFAARDIVRLIALGVNLKEVSISSGMRNAFITLRQPEVENLSAACQLLHQHQLPCLLIVDEQNCLASVVTPETIFQQIATSNVSCEPEQLKTKLTEHKQAEEAIFRLDQELENRIAERTAALKELNKQLVFEIAERVESEEELSRYKLLADHSRDIILFIDREGRIIEANKAAVQAYGYYPEELTHLTIQDLRVPEEQDFITEQMAQADEKGVLFTTIHRRKNGSRFPVEVSSQATTIGNTQFYLSIIRDITERTQAEEALKRREQEFTTLVENVPDIIARFDREGRHLYINPVIELATGIPPQAFIGKTNRELGMPEANLSVWEQALTQIFETKNEETIEFTFDSPTGLKYYQSRLVPEFGANGEPVSILGISRDITEHKLAGSALKESEERFRNLVETTSDWVWEADEHYAFTYVNPQVRNILGYEPQEVLGKTPFDFMSPEETFRFANVFGPIVAQRNSFSCFESTYIHKNGQLIIFETSGVPILDGSGEFRGYRGISRDITERKQSEEVLRQSEERFRVIFEREAIGVALVNFKGQFLAINPKFQEMIGYGETEIHGMVFTEITHPDYRAADVGYFEELMAGNIDFYEMEKRYIRKDGGVVWGHLTVSSIRTATGVPQLAIATTQDITERKLMEEALRESEERFRQLAEHIDEVFWMSERNHTQTLYVSPAYEKIWGLTCQSLYEQPRSWVDAIHPRDKEYVFAALERLGESYSIEYRIIRPDGSMRWIRDRAFPVRDATGEVYRLVGLAEDITERKQADEALRESEERFRKIFEESPIGIATTSPTTGRFIRANKALCQMLGYTESELSELTFAAVTYPTERENCLAYFKKLKLAEFSSYKLEQRYLKKNEEILWGNKTFTIMRDANGKIVNGLAMIEDITQRKRAEEEIEFLQSMAKAVYESEDFHSALGMTIQKVCEVTKWDFGEAWIPSTEGNFLECSPAWYSSTERLKEFRTMTEQMTFAPGIGIPGRVWLSKQAEWRRDVSNDSEPIFIRAAIAKQVGLKAALGIPLLTVDGSILAVLVFYMFESQDEDSRLIELISASTELGLLIQRKRAEEEVRKALEKEKELNELKTRFINMTSHEFRTPLGTILSSAELLENYRHKWSEEKQINHLHRIQATVQHMTELLEYVLTIGRAEAGKMEFNPAPVDLMKLCQDVIEQLEATDANKNRIVFTHQHVCGSTCMDEKLLRHILMNLLSNALKYSSKTSPVQFSLWNQEKQIIFQVQDQGIGIPNEDQKRLFESFHRASNVGTISGTGLGLAIVKRCVDLHGGKIVASSQVGVGSNFTVTLPLAAP